jgi:iron complex outermembrane recepter protein
MTKPVPHLAAKIIFLLSLCLVQNAVAQEPAFKATLKSTSQNNKNVPVKGEKELTEILVQLELIYDVTFAYQKKYLSGKTAVFNSLVGVQLEDYLSEILTKLKLGFKKIGDGGQTIYVIMPLEEIVVDADSVSGVGSHGGEKDHAVVSVAGTVRNDVNGVPVGGVNVFIKGTSIGTLTAADGSFTLELPSNVDVGKSLVFSHIGFARQEIDVTSGDPLNVRLRENIECLSELIVTAMGIERDPQALNYSVSNVTAEQLTASGTTNFASAMYGKVPGVRIRTAPGGATSAVTVQIRGFNSLNYNTQPHYIIDGVPLRDSNEKGAAGVNNDHYFTDSRIRGNGILDISPADIESITILKGASATALYGSDASNGAVVITTKKGMHKSGIGVDVNYSFSREDVAFLPEYQNVYGPGYDRETNLALGSTAEGWKMVDTDGDGIGETRSPMFRAYGQFGPRMDGQSVLWWDGNMRPYSAEPDNYKDFYRKGYNSQVNVSLQDESEKSRYRISYSRNDYEGIQVGGKLQRNALHTNTSLQLTKKLRVDWMANFSSTGIHNRPYKINRLTDSYSGFFSRAEKMSLFFDRYQTSQGFKWVPYDQSERNPEEALHYVTPRGVEVMNILWRQLRDSEDEKQQRFISSLTLNQEISRDLSFRGRFGADITDVGIVSSQHNEYPVAFNTTSSTGAFTRTNARYLILYGDALLSYSRALSSDLSMDLNAGVQVRDERYSDLYKSTNGGLKDANVFTLANSYYPELITTNSRMSLLKYAYLGIASLNYKDMLYLEATGRQEYSSTLPPGSNRYFYPSLNTGFVFSNVISLPSFFDYGKLRAAYGVVGNSPPVYEANIRYDQKQIPTVNGNTNAGSPSGNLFGNNSIMPERKYELEIGMDLRMLKSRIGLDLTYYRNRVKDQILRLDLPSSTGAGKILTNVGELEGYGYEAGLNALLVNGTLKWNAAVNVAYSTTKVRELMPGVDQLVFREMEGNAIQVVAEKGQPIGNIYVYPRKTDESGNFVINGDGLYIIDKTRHVKAGNVLPKVTGGLATSFVYKSFSLSTLLDYSLGGQMISVSQKYHIGSGMYESTLRYRDAAHGGLSYYVDDNGENVAWTGAVAPNGSAIYHDGIILEGVTEEGTPNGKIVDAPSYYLNTFSWGNDSWNEGGALYDNDFIKMRELVFTWSLPKVVIEKLHFQKVQLSLVGRNLFYVWRTMKNADPESSIGTTWLSQGIDEGSNAATRSYGLALNMSF